jgi:hypothetical protein
MERFTARKAQPAARPAGQATQPAQETFSEMANVTAAKSGMVGKLLVVSLIVVSIAITAFVGYAIIRGVGGGNLIKGDKYQAVFLTDGQIYFGKLKGIGESYATLEDIFYLQVEQQVQPDRETDANAQTQISLAKLGNELHGPEDQMYINVSQILFWENLKSEGQVSTAIKNFKENGGNATQPDTTPSADTTKQDTTPADTTTGN